MKKTLLCKLVKELENKNPSTFLTDVEAIDNGLGQIKKNGFYLIVSEDRKKTTSLMLKSVLNMAKEGHKVCFFPCNSSEMDTVKKIMVEMTGVPEEEILSDKPCSRETMELVKEAAEKLRKYPIVIEDMLCPNETSLMDSILINDEYKNTEIILIDGLNYLTTDNTYVNRKEELEGILRELRNYQYIMDIPVLISVNIMSDPLNASQDKITLTELHKVCGRAEDIANGVLFLNNDGTDSVIIR